MPHNRLQRIDEEVKKELSFLIRGLKDPRISGMASITAARVTRDLRHAKVYVSVLGSEDEKKETMQGLRSADGFLRRELASRVGLRNTPELHFHLDNTIETGTRISKILNDLNITHDTEEQDDELDQSDV